MGSTFYPQRAARTRWVRAPTRCARRVHGRCRTHAPVPFPSATQVEIMQAMPNRPPIPAEVERRGEANASWNLGLALEKQGELARAVQSMQVCVDYEREFGHPDAEANAAHVQEIRARLGGELDPEAQAELWHSWVEGGPQGPIEDEDEVELP